MSVSHCFRCIFLLIFAVQSLTAQTPYQLFRPDVQYLYHNPLVQNEIGSPLVGIQLTEATCNFTYDTAVYEEEGGFGCVRRYPSFIGHEVCKGASLTRLNIQSDEDPFYLDIFVQQPAGTTWIANDDTADTIIARVDEIILADVLGLVDSIKHIGLYRMNTDGTLMPLHEEPSLAISRQYGLVSATFLPTVYEERGSFTLAGMSEPSVGVQNPTNETILDLNIGDEQHIQRLSFDLGESRLVYQEQITTLVELSYEISSASHLLIYDLVEREYYGNSTDTLQRPMRRDTVHIPVNEVVFLDNQPGSLVENTQLDWWHTVELGHTFFCERPAKRLSTPFTFPGGTDCGFFVIDAIPGAHYFADLAGPFYAFFSIAGPDERVLQYWQPANGTACGTPFDFVTATDDASSFADGNIRVWPNPTNDQFTVDLPPVLGLQRISLFNASGKLLWSKNEPTVPFTYDMRTLPAGSYWLQLMDAQGVTQIVTLIKQ